MVADLLAAVSDETGLTAADVVVEDGRFTVTAPLAFISALAARPEIEEARTASPEVAVGL